MTIVDKLLSLVQAVVKPLKERPEGIMAVLFGVIVIVILDLGYGLEETLAAILALILIYDIYVKKACKI